MKIELDVEDINKVLAYLSRCPYADVAHLVKLLQSGKPVDDTPKMIKPVEK